MPQIALILGLFAIVLWVASWAVNATMPGSVDWVWAQVGGGAAWAVFIVVIILAIVYGILDQRRAGGKSKDKDK